MRDVGARWHRGAALAGGFGLAGAVSAHAYVTAFGGEASSHLGFVAKTEFSLLTNGLSVIAAVALIVLAVRLAHAGRARHLPHGLVAAGAGVLAAGYAAGALGLFAALPDPAGFVACAAAYAVGMMVITLAWFEPFVLEEDGGFAVRCMVAGYLVQAAFYAVLSFLSGWALFTVAAAALAVSVGLLMGLRAGKVPGAVSSGTVPPGEAAAAPLQPEPAHSLREVVSGLSGSFICLFTLTAVVGLLHTSVIGNDFEYVVGAVPMSEALVVATVLLALVVFVSRRVPEASTVYRVLFPVMLVALSLVPFVSSGLGPFAGMIMVVCYDLVGMAFVLLLMEVARGSRTPPAALMGMYQAGTQLSLIVGLVLGLVLSGLHASPDVSYTTILILVCIYLLAMVLIVLLRRRARGGASGLLEGDAGEGQAAEAPAEPQPAVGAVQQTMRERVGSEVERYALERGLTPREAQVAVQLARGRSAAALAADLGMAENTAWAHIKRIYAKLGVHGKQELIDLIEHEVISSVVESR